MARYLSIHPEDPQPRMLGQAAEILRSGGVVAIPTDSCYALGCGLGDKDAVERIRRIREVDDRHHLTLMCRDLSEIAQFARVDNAQYRLLKATTPGSCLPSRYSREAPPPVEMWLILSARPVLLTAETESPPPTMETASESATALATASVPLA